MANPYQPPRDVESDKPRERLLKDAEHRNLLLFFAALLVLGAVALGFAAKSAIP